MARDQRRTATVGQKEEPVRALVQDEKHDNSHPGRFPFLPVPAPTCFLLFVPPPSEGVNARSSRMGGYPGAVDVGNSASMIVRGHTQAQHEIRAEMA